MTQNVQVENAILKQIDSEKSKAVSQLMKTLEEGVTSAGVTSAGEKRKK